MRACQDLSVRFKVVGLFGVAIMVTAGLGLFSMDRLRRVNAAAEIHADFLPGTIALGDIAHLSVTYRQLEASSIMADTAEDIARDQATMEETRNRLETVRNAYEPLIHPGEERQLAAAFQEAWNDYLRLGRVLADLVVRNDDAAASALYSGPMLDSFNRYLAALQADRDYNSRRGVAAGNQARSTHTSARGFIVAGLGIALVLSVAAALTTIFGMSIRSRSLSRH